MGACILRSSDRNQKGQKDLCPVPEGYYGGWVPDVSVQHIPTPLRQPGECGSAYPAGEKEPAAERKCRDNVHYR